MNKHKDTGEEKLYKKLSISKEKDDEYSQEEADKVVKDIANVAEAKYLKVMEELNKMKPEEGRIDSQKKLFPKSRDHPSAMLDKGGNILTADKAIDNFALEVYTEWLQANKIMEHLKSYEETKNKLCETRLMLTKLNKTAPWSMEDLEDAIKDIGRNKSRDAPNYANELFKEEVAGCDLKLAVLKLMNSLNKGSNTQRLWSLVIRDTVKTVIRPSHESSISRIRERWVIGF